MRYRNDATLEAAQPADVILEKGDMHGYESSTINFRFGSDPVLADLAQRRRLSEVERASRPRKRT